MGSTQNTKVFLVQCIKYLIVFSALFVCAPAHADYVAFQNLWEIPQGATSPDYVQQGMSGSSRLDMQYIATTTVTQFDRVDVALCRNGGSNIGSVRMEVRYSATSSTVLSSSTVNVTSGNIWDSTGCVTGTGFATSTTFTLNQPIQWVSGVTVWLSFFLQSTDPASTFYFSFVDEAISASENGSYRAYINNVLFETPSPNRSMRIIGRGLGTAPTVSTFYGASSTPVVCGTFDIGCYISTSFTFLFIPSTPFENYISQITPLASTTPFSYPYDLNQYLYQLRNGIGTSTILSVPFNGNDIVIFNSAIIETYIPNSNDIKDTIGYVIWFIALFVVAIDVFHFMFGSYTVTVKENDS